MIPANGTEWKDSAFDPNAWGYRGEGDSEDEGLLDKGLGMMGFGDNDENSSFLREATTASVFVLSFVSAWMMLL